MHPRRLAPLAATLATTAFLATCGGSSPSSPSPGDGGGGIVVPPPVTTITVYAAGDIGECGFGALDTGRLLDRLPGVLLGRAEDIRGVAVFGHEAQGLLLTAATDHDRDTGA